VSRGGGVMLHLPGQVACYPILPLDVLNLAPADYVNELLETGIELLGKFNIQGVIDPDRPGIRANGRRIIHLGAAIRDRITSFGLVVNVNPDLDLFHKIHCDGDDVPMTSIQRESNCRLRISGIRQQLVELISNRFGFDRVSIFHNHPSLWPRSTRYVAAQRP
jgi:lipoate-protein ligase B